MMHHERGFNIIEVIAASVIGAVLAGGTLMAFVTALRISQRASSADLLFLAQQTLERYRNHVACEDSLWFDKTTCATTLTSCVPDDAKCFHEVEEQLPEGIVGAIRQYRVVPEDCNDDGFLGDCLRLTARVTTESVR